MENIVKPTWDDMIDGLCKEPEIIKCKTREEVYKEMEEYLINRYGELTPDEKIKNIANEITNGICEKMNIDVLS